MANIAEVRARGATVVALCEAGDEATDAVADHALEIPAVPELLSPVVAIVPLQVSRTGSPGHAATTSTVPATSPRW